MTESIENMGVRGLHLFYAETQVTDIKAVDPNMAIILPTPPDSLASHQEEDE